MNERIYEIDEATVVTLIIATHDGPRQIDVAVANHALDPDDPRQPGDLIWHDAETDQQEFITGLRAVATVLGGAS